MRVRTGPHETRTQTLRLSLPETVLPSDANEPADIARPGRTAAFVAVVNEHWAAVYRLLYSMTGNTHDTEDLTQEAFLRAMRRFDSFEPGTNVRAWLLRIAANAFFDCRRKRQRAHVQTLAHDPPAEPQPPDAGLLFAEQHELLRAGLEELTDLTRMVFHLRATEGLSFREIARLAGTT